MLYLRTCARLVIVVSVSPSSAQNDPGFGLDVRISGTLLSFTRSETAGRLCAHLHHHVVGATWNISKHFYLVIKDTFFSLTIFLRKQYFSKSSKILFATRFVQFPTRKIFKYLQFYLSELCLEYSLCTVSYGFQYNWNYIHANQWRTIVACQVVVSEIAIKIWWYKYNNTIQTMINCLIWRMSSYFVIMTIVLLKFFTRY